jgi:hypothetical protein
LRPDPDTDFLGSSLADAISTSLAGHKPWWCARALAAFKEAGGERLLDV